MPGALEGNVVEVELGEKIGGNGKKTREQAGKQMAA